MRVDSGNRERLRSGLLGPLGQEVTDMLMEEIDQSGLRNHVDERFDEQKREMNKRFDEQKREMDKRFDEVNKRFDEIGQRFIEVHAAIKDIGKDTKLMVFSICGAFAVVTVATLFESLRG